MADSTYKTDIRRAVIGGSIAAIIVFLGTFFIGRLGQTEAFVALKEMRPSLRFISSAVLTSTSTILALLLTLLSFSGKTDRDLKPRHFRRIELIAQLSSIAFAAAIVLLMFLALPLESADEKFRTWYRVIYYTFIIMGALLGGTMVTVILMLFQAAKAVIVLFHPNQKADHLLLTKEE
jgi:magnesium-transporting ATPase (P-type)